MNRHQLCLNSITSENILANVGIDVSFLVVDIKNGSHYYIFLISHLTWDIKIDAAFSIQGEVL
jgi:hypothetical protein